MPSVTALNDLTDLCRDIGALLQARGEWLATAESCTGGLVAKRLTDVDGASRWFERGLVTYSNAAKCELLGVPAALIARDGAVSEAVARAMAEGAARAPAHWGIAITGIAGPGGGSADKPVGTVWVAWARRGGAVEAERLALSGSREAIREASAQAALEGLRARLRTAA